MSMYVNKYYSDFLATVVVESDEIGEIDLLNKEFRIDVIDVVTESAKAEAYQIALENEEKNRAVVSEGLKKASLGVRECTYTCNDNNYTDQFIDGMQSAAGKALETIYNSIADYSDDIPSITQLNRNLKAWPKFLVNWKETYLYENNAFDAIGYNKTLDASSSSETAINTLFSSTVSSGVEVDGTNKFIGFRSSQKYNLIASVEVTGCGDKDGASFNICINDKAVPVAKSFDASTQTMTFDFSLNDISDNATELFITYAISNFEQNAITYKVTNFSIVKEYWVEPKEESGVITPGKESIANYVDEIIATLNSIVGNASELPLSYDNTPMLSINHKNSNVYCNADYESLLRNGMQYWISDDKKSLYFRFVPQLRAEKQFQAIHVSVSFDSKNVTNFEISLMPRLITGEIHKRTENAVDPVLDYGTKSDVSEEEDVIETIECVTCSATGIVKGQPCPTCNGLKFMPLSASRVDYVYNTPEVDNNHLYVNNTTLTKTELQTPVYEVNSSAYIAEDMIASGYGYDMKKIRSYLYDNLTSIALNLPYKIRPLGIKGDGGWVSARSDILELEPGETSIKLITDYKNDSDCPEAGMTYDELNEITVKGYEICQTISASGNWDDAGNLFVKNQIYLSMEV